jgi:hypothetical protein
MGDYIGNGSKYFYLSKRLPNNEKYKKKAITVKDTIDEVSELLKKEKRLANHIATILGSTSGQAEIIKQKTIIDENLHNSFEMILNQANLDISPDMMTESQTLNTLDEKLKQAMEKRNDFDITFSFSNPWLKLYTEINIADELTSEYCKKYVEEILVERFEKVILISKYNEWKLLLPSYWLEV